MAEDSSQFIRQRAKLRCEYCHLPQRGHDQQFSIDHVIARKHGGPDTADNLALSCIRCNLHKGTDLAGIDRPSGALVPLFNPRRDVWAEHFSWNGPLLAGITPTGRTTVALLKMNVAERIRLRESLILEGVLSLD